MSPKRCQNRRSPARSSIVGTILVGAILGIVPAVPAQLIDDTFTYQGRLKLNNQTINGPTDLAFYLWDAETAGNLLGTPIALPATPVSDGLFTVSLNFDAPDFSGDGRWLQVAARYPAGSPTGYTFLNPRQPIRPTPYSLTALEALAVPGIDGHSLDAADGSPVDALFADNAGNVGIGTLTPHANFRFQLAGGAGAWKGGIAGGGATAATVLGELSGVATLGGHNAALTAWTDLAINPVSGNVGIGTTAPARKLDVNGTARAGVVEVGVTATQGLLIDDDHIDTLFGAPLLLQSQSLGMVNIGTSLGIGTTTPASRLSIVGDVDISGSRLHVATGGSVGIGTTTPNTRLHVVGGSDAEPASGGFIVSGNTTGLNVVIDDNEIMARNNGAASPLYLNNDGGNVVVRVLEIVGGSDVAEPYDVAPAGEAAPRPGMVVAIDPENVGRMRVVSTAYDRTVAGIISGANGIKPGITLSQTGTVADGAMPVASIGRVWCWCDADASGPIAAGDMLTPSDTPGHAMRVTDHDRAHGAVLGKAMSSLKSGKGLVLVLVSLQ